MRLGLLVLCTACGRLNFDPFGSNPDDGDAPSDGDVALSGCWTAWRSGTLQLTTPQPVAELASSEQHGDPSLSRDGLALYFSRGDDLVLARRADRSAPWQAPAVVAELSSPADDSKLSITDDGLLAIWSSNRPPSNGYDLWQATRSTPEGMFSTPSTVPLAGLNDARNQFDPHISGDGLRLYYAPVIGSTQQIRLATRDSRTDAFGQAMTVPLDSNLAADPALSPDELVIVYTSGTSVMPQMYYATRARGGATTSAQPGCCRFTTCRSTIRTRCCRTMDASSTSSRDAAAPPCSSTSAASSDPDARRPRRPVSSSASAADPGNRASPPGGSDTPQVP